MLSSQLGQVVFKIAFFLILVSVGLLFFVEPGSAEFVVTVLTLFIGIVFAVVVVVLVRRRSQ
ncbi:MAG: hypothetical protein JXA33_00720 [Anaerolineae bacterium]|nr:hypothetical protein [Anaerolineae bacterium]